MRLGGDVEVSAMTTDVLTEIDGAGRSHHVQPAGGA